MSAETTPGEFDNWMHDRGYQYMGPTSIYKLTVPEIVRLHKGWRRQQEKEAAAQRSEIGDTRVSAHSSNPHRQGYHPSQVRQSDLKTARNMSN